MSGLLRATTLVSACSLSILLTACGGGGDSSLPQASAQLPALISEPGAPPATGDTATDTVNWFNFRRQQAGLSPLTRNATLDLAAQNHSNYQELNTILTHDEIAGNPGFTGSDPPHRLAAVGYQLTRPPADWAEVAAQSADPRGAYLAEGFLAAIYHRFVVLEPRYREIGAGAAAAPNGYTYVTADITANGYGPAPAPGTVAVYPPPNQQRVPPIFYNNLELPTNPVPDRSPVGYPVSVQSGLDIGLTVTSFTIAPHGGAPLAVRLLSAAVDAETPSDAAAIIPLDVLQAGTTYDVQFVGSAGGQPVSQTWSFTTQ